MVAMSLDPTNARADELTPRRRAHPRPKRSSLPLLAAAMGGAFTLARRGNIW
jgi:hypothetical protein